MFYKLQAKCIRTIDLRSTCAGYADIVASLVALFGTCGIVNGGGIRERLRRLKPQSPKVDETVQHLIRIDLWSRWNIRPVYVWRSASEPEVDCGIHLRLRERRVVTPGRWVDCE